MERRRNTNGRESSHLCKPAPSSPHACATLSIERRRLRRGWRGITVQRMGWLVSTGLSRPLRGLPMGRAEQAARSVHWHKGCPAGTLLCRLHTPAPYGLQRTAQRNCPHGCRSRCFASPPPHHRASLGFLGFSSISMREAPQGRRRQHLGGSVPPELLPARQAQRVSGRSLPVT